MSKPTYSTTYGASRPAAFAVTAKRGRAGVSTTTVTESVGASGDDGWFDEMGMSFNNGQSYMQVGYDDGSMYAENLFVRFQTVPLAQGTVIATATLKLVVNTNASADFDMTVQGEDADDSAAYADETDATSASLTTATVTWAGDSSWASGDTVTSPDVTTIIQEIVDRSGWATGNDLTLQVIYGGGSSSAENYRFKTYDNDSSVAAVLTVTY
tara:strand:- start:9971 stop:10606 length:636 start_codon:yes stop_codon:yes gene_type:complete